MSFSTVDEQVAALLRGCEAVYNEAELRERVAAELKTTFASHYTREVSLAEALQLEQIAVYGRRATGEKHLINPNKGLAS